MDCRRLTGCRRWIRRGCLGSILVLLLALLGLHLHFSLRRAAAEKDVETVLAALRADGIPVTPEELDVFYTHVPDEENAALVYKQAFEAMVMPDLEAPVDPEHPDLGTMGEWLPFLGEAEFEPGQDVPPLTLAAIDRCLAPNVKALELLHKATGYEKARFPLKLLGVQLADTDFPHCAQLANAHNLLQIHALRQSLVGSSAVPSLTAARAAGRSLVEEPVLVSFLGGMALCLMSDDSLQDYLSRFTPEPKDLQILTDAWARDAGFSPISRALAWDVCNINQLSQMGVDEWATLDGSGKNATWTGWAYRASGLQEEDRALLLGFFYQLVRLNRLPLNLRRTEVERYVQGWRSRPSGFITLGILRGGYFGRIVVGLIAPGFAQPTLAEYKYVASTRISLAALHIELLRLRDGKLPDSLDAVAAAYPDLDLTDPFDGQRLRYRRLEEGGYVIYSVGEEGVDGGGDDSRRARPQPDIVFRVTR